MVSRTREFSDPLTLLGAPWGSLSSSSLLHDAPRQPITPSFQSPRVVLDDIPSSGHGVFKVGLASESQRTNRYERRNISLVPYSCRLLQSSTFQITLQPRPALTRTSSQSNTRHDPKNGQARKQIHIPLVHEVLSRCPGPISYPMTNEDWREEASGTTFITACLSQPYLTVGGNQSSLAASSARMGI